jgi:host factor-I protein
METNLLDSMLTGYRDRKTAVTFVLQNQARVSGTVRAFDNYVIVLEGPKSEIIYRHAISSLAPSAAAAAARPAAPQRTEQPKPALRPQTRPAERPRQRTDKTPPPAAAAAAPAQQTLNTGMKEGLLRWMQEQKASK